MISQIDEYLSVLNLDKSSHTIRLYNTAINKLIEFLNVKDFNDIENISSGDLRKFQDHLIKNGSQKSTVNSYMRPLRAMFNWLVDNEYLDKTPFSKVKDLKAQKKVKEFLSEDEQKQLLDNCNDVVDKIVILLLLSTGIRREELCSLLVSEYNGTHIVVFGKGNKERKLRLQEGVIEILNSYLANRKIKSEYLIVSRLGNRFTGDGIYKKIKNIAERSGINPDRLKEVHPHTFRHSFFANMMDAGADIFACQQLLGHATVNTTMRYAHIHSNTLDNLMQKQKSLV